MLNASKLKKLMKKSGLSAGTLAKSIVRAGLDEKAALTAMRNWEKGLLKPRPKSADLEALASSLRVEATVLSQWKASIK